MMAQVVKEGTGTAAALQGIQVAGKTGTAEIEIGNGINPALVHRLRARRPPAHRGRGHGGAVQRAGRYRCRAHRQAGDGGAAGELIDIAAPGRVDRRPLPRSVRASARAGWPTSTAREDLQLGRNVALKLLYRRFAEDEEFVERFRREASAAAGLQHPNVVGVYDRGEWDGTYYIAMEYLEGRSLKQLIQRARRRWTRPGDRPGDPDPQGGPLRPQARGHPPRPQAPQRDRRRRGPRQGHRLRHRPGRRVGHDRDRLDHGHRAVPVARAGPGPRGQRAAPTSTRSGSSSTRCSPGAVPFEGDSAGDDRAQAGLRAARRRRASSTRRSRPSSTRS